MTGVAAPAGIIPLFSFNVRAGNGCIVGRGGAGGDSVSVGPVESISPNDGGGGASPGDCTSAGGGAPSGTGGGKTGAASTLVLSLALGLDFEWAAVAAFSRSSAECTSGWRLAKSGLSEYAGLRLVV